MESKKRNAQTLRFGVAIAGLLVFATGCRLPFMPSRGPTAPVLLSAEPTANEIAMAVGDQSGRVQQVQAQVRLSVQDMPGLSGQMRFERPRRLRIQAKMLGIGGPGVDIGSNDESFWIWLQSNLPGVGPGFVYAKHEEFAATLSQQRIPLQPEWIADSLGLVTIPPQAMLEGPFKRNDKNWELRFREETAAGPMTRVLIVENGTARVIEQYWYDVNARLLAQARSSDFEYLEPPSVSMPRRVVLTVAPGTADQMSLTLQMSGIAVNQPSGNEALWLMPDPGNVPSVDIGRPGGLSTGIPTNLPTQLAPQQAPTYPETGFRPQFRGATYR